MVCRRCGVELIEGSKFCHECGTKLALSFDEIKCNVQKRVKNSYLEPFGLWEVSTYSDSLCTKERVLGVFEGFIDDIAFSLYHKSNYELKFKKLPANKLVKESDSLGGVVEISLKGVETYDGLPLTDDEEKALICILMQNRPTSVFESDKNLKPILVRSIKNSDNSTF